MSRTVPPRLSIFATGEALPVKLLFVLPSAGIKVADAELATFNLRRPDLDGEWNYTISPRRQP
jgi:hypothetical protein